jgi:long-subunit acyl-CoA synthetase (AMP-forming)
MYTSGASGDPKAVSITHKKLMASLTLLLSNGKINLKREAETHVYLSFLPLAHIIFLDSLLNCIYSSVSHSIQ